MLFPRQTPKLYCTSATNHSASALGGKMAFWASSMEASAAFYHHNREGTTTIERGNEMDDEHSPPLLGYETLGDFATYMGLYAIWAIRAITTRRHQFLLGFSIFQGLRIETGYSYQSDTFSTYTRVLSYRIFQHTPNKEVGGFIFF